MSPGHTENKAGCILYTQNYGTDSASAKVKYPHGMVDTLWVQHLSATR